MSDAHSHDEQGHESHGNNTAKAESNDIHSVDQWFNKVLEYIGQKISTFIAFLFFLFTMGAVFGAVSIVRFPEYAPIMIFAPAALGLVAYYNRTIATIAFIVLIVLFII
jgi:ABC-type multidrug transport system fused ATPase/permease subunit